MTDVEQEQDDVVPPAQSGFGKRLKAARERAGFSQEDVVARLGLSHRSITRWENGESDPGFCKVVMMAELYRASTDWIAGRTSIETCIQPGMILVDNEALALLEKLVAGRKTVHDIPEQLLHGPGIDCTAVVPSAPNVMAPDAAEIVEKRVRSLWKQLGGKS